MEKGSRSCGVAGIGGIIKEEEEEGEGKGEGIGGGEEEEVISMS